MPKQARPSFKKTVWPFVLIQLTGVDHYGHGSLLDDRANHGERGEAAVVPPAVLLLGMGEVQVSIQADGHPRILLDGLQPWVNAEAGGGIQRHSDLTVS